MNVIDLLSSPSIPPEGLHAPNKRSRSDTVQGTQDILVPSLSALMTQFPKRDSLYAHLDTLPKPMLISMLLEQAKGSLPTAEAQFYGSPNNLAHCVYCHKLFDKTAPIFDCKIKHFGNLEEEEDYNPDTKMYFCCGLIVRGYEYYREDREPPPEERASKYCSREGKHFDRELEEGDPDAKGIWWKEWKEYGDNCTKMGCHKRPNGGHLDKRPKRQ